MNESNTALQVQLAEAAVNFEWAQSILKQLKRISEEEKDRNVDVFVGKTKTLNYHVHEFCKNMDLLLNPNGGDDGKFKQLKEDAKKKLQKSATHQQNSDHSQSDGEVNLSGTIWDWYNDGTGNAVDGAVELTPGNQIKWNGGVPQGSWKVEGDILTMALNGTSHNLHLSKDGREAVLTAPKKNPPSKMIRRVNLSGTIWDWYNDGTGSAVDGAVELTPDNQIKWNGGVPQGSWKLEGDVLTMALNGMSHELHFSKDGREAVLTAPKKNPPSKMIRREDQMSGGAGAKNHLGATNASLPGGSKQQGSNQDTFASDANQAGGKDGTYPRGVNQQGSTGKDGSMTGGMSQEDGKNDGSLSGGAIGGSVTGDGKAPFLIETLTDKQIEYGYGVTSDKMNEFLTNQRIYLWLIG